MTRTSRALLLALAAAAGVAHAQPCAPGWLLDRPRPGMSQPLVYSMTARPAALGGGVYAAGAFPLAGAAVAHGMALWDGSAWSPLGLGVDGTIYASAVLHDGGLVVGGTITGAGGAPVNRIARWDGTRWWPLGSGVDDTVKALAVTPSGDIIAGGIFRNAGGAPARGIARWNGSAWAPMADGLNTVGAITILPDGAICAAEAFGAFGTPTVRRIARWTGQSWAPIGAGIGGPVNALLALPDGGIVAGGTFIYAADGAPLHRIARWDGVQWRPMFVGFNGAVDSLALLPNGRIVAAGNFTTAGDRDISDIAQWDGEDWLPVGVGPRPTAGSEAFALAVTSDGSLYAGGSFSEIAGFQTRSIARWSGSDWWPVPVEINDQVLALAPAENGTFYLGGRFNFAGGRRASGIALYEPASPTPFSPLGAGCDGIVETLLRLPGGRLFAGGVFSNAGGTPSPSAAIWDGQAWSPMGAGITGPHDGGPDPGVYASAILPNGDLIVGGRFSSAGGAPAACLARWNGSAWSPLGGGIAGGTYTAVYALHTVPSGDLLVGGSFASAGGVPASCIARWNGAAFSPLGAGVAASQYYSRVFCIAPLDPARPDGALVIGGDFRTAGGLPAIDIATWTNGSWAAMGDGLGSGLNTPVRALTHDPAGSLLAAGEFLVSGATTLRAFARWTGSAWTAPDPAFRGRAFAAARLTTGELALGGDFNGVDGLHDGFLKRWTFDGSPAIAEQPAPTAAHCGAPAAFTVRPVPGYGSTTFTWRHAGIPLDPLDPRFIVESDDQGSTLTIFPILPGDGGPYDCLIALPCGSRASLPADLTITACCPADFNGDGFLDFFDYADFTACFEAGACPPGLTADFNGDQFVDFFDYADFVAAFEMGC